MRCEYVFPGGNRCQFDSGHISGHIWAASREVPRTEMTSLREIKAKLDALQQSQDVLRQSTIGLLIEEVRAIAESQGKLLAALNETDARVMAECEEIRGMISQVFQELQIVKVWTRKPKPRKKARR